MILDPYLIFVSCFVLTVINDQLELQNEGAGVVQGK